MVLRNMPLWVIAPEQEHVMSNPPGFTTCIARAFKLLYIPDALCNTYKYKRWSMKEVGNRE